MQNIKFSQSMNMFFMVMVLMSTASLAAAEPWEVPSDKNLEVSLLSLRDNAQSIQERNQWLGQEMVRLDQLMDEMRQDLALLNDSQSENPDVLAQALDNQVKDLSINEKEDLRQKMALSQVQSEQERLKEELDLKLQQEAQLKSKIESLASELDQLKQSKASVSIPVSGTTAELAQYRILVEQSSQKLAQREKEYTALKRKYDRPFEAISRLQQVQADLNSKKEMVEDELKVAFEEETILNNDISQVQQKSQSQIGQTSQQIAVLQRRDTELSDILEKAKSKINGKNIQLDNTQSAEALKVIWE